MFSHAISCRLAHIIGAAQLNKLLTIFADDYLAAGTFESLHELEQLLSCIAVLFKVLQSFGMAVSDAKSKAVFALRGTLSPSIRRKFIRKGNDGPLLRIPQLGGDLCIPIVSQFRYLGVQLRLPLAVWARSSRADIICPPVNASTSGELVLGLPCHMD